MYMKPENIFAQIAEAGEEEQFDLLFKSPNCRIDRIVSSGHSSPKGFWYDQENDEFILLIQGEATLEFEDRKVTLKKGDYLHIPKNCKHRLDSTSIDPVVLQDDCCAFEALVQKYGESVELSPVLIFSVPEVRSLFFYF